MLPLDMRYRLCGRKAIPLKKHINPLIQKEIIAAMQRLFSKTQAMMPALQAKPRQCFSNLHSWGGLLPYRVARS